MWLDIVLLSLLFTVKSFLKSNIFTVFQFEKVPTADSAVVCWTAKGPRAINCHRMHLTWEGSQTDALSASNRVSWGSLGICLGCFQPRGDPEADPGYGGEIMGLGWLGKHLDITQEKLEKEREVCLGCCPQDPDSKRQKTDLWSLKESLT